MRTLKELLEESDIDLEKVEYLEVYDGEYETLRGWQIEVKENKEVDYIYVKYKDGSFYEIHDYEH